MKRKQRAARVDEKDVQRVYGESFVGASNQRGHVLWVAGTLRALSVSGIPPSTRPLLRVPASAQVWRGQRRGGLNTPKRPPCGRPLGGR